MKIHVLGAAGGEVTGSCYLVETARARVVVDCGMFQGSRGTEKRNRTLPVPRPKQVDAVVLTHAHLDHCGRLPLLVKEGFAGPIHATGATIATTDIILRDAAHLQQMDAERRSRKLMRAGRAPTAPLYSIEDVEKTLGLLRRLPFGESREVAPGVTVKPVEAGHILGAASIEMRVQDGAGPDKIVVFSGDIGPIGMPLLRDPAPPAAADLLFLESTYGDRNHRSLSATIDELVGIIESARTPRGRVIIPAFAVGRTQALIYLIGVLARQNRLHEPRVYIDSPMAIETLELYRGRRDLFDEASMKIVREGAQPLDFAGLHLARTVQESMALNNLGDGVVIISASGMCTGGRILHHLKHGLWKPETHIVFVGYQARGTPGRRIVDGQPAVSIMGERIAVKAKIHTVGGLSAHAGQDDLLGWAGAMAESRPRIMLTHGENGPRSALRAKLKERFGLDAELPDEGQVVEV